MFRHNMFNLLMAPEAPASGSGTSELTKSDILDYLNKDDDDVKDDVIPLKDDKDDKKTKEAKDEDDKETDKGDDEDKEADDEDNEDSELKELEEELEDPDEDKLELSTPTSRREILKKYPKLFKDFPYLETAYYREQAFTKILPTIKDAEQAVEKSEILDRFENDLATGNTETILKAVKQNDPKAFNKIVDDYMTTLAKVDEKSYHHVLGNTIKHTIIAMIQESRNSGIEALESAAQIVNQFVFGSSKFTHPSKLTKDNEDSVDDTKKREIEEREKSFAKREFEKVNTELTSKVNKAYRATIEARIDPKDSMSEYVKKTAVREAMEELESLINKDTRFKTLIDKLWERSFKDSHSQEAVGRIRSAFVSKAQTLLPSVIQKARNNALKGMGKRADHKSDNRDDKDDDSRQVSKESKNGKESSRNKDSRSSGGKIPDGMSSLEYLMSDD